MFLRYALVWEAEGDIQLTGSNRFVEYDPVAHGTAYLMCAWWEHTMVSDDTGRVFAPSPTFEYSELMDFKVAKASAGRAWRVTSNLGIFQTDDYGQSWRRITEQFVGGDTIVRNMDVIGTGDSLILAGGSNGVYFTRDNGGSFDQLWRSYPAGEIADIVRIVTREPMEIWIQARHAGLWTYTRTDSTDANPHNRQATTGTVRVSVFPNPTAGALIVSANGWRAGYAIEISNVLGQRIAFDQCSRGGSQVAIVLPAMLPAGNYFLRIVDAKARKNAQRLPVIRITKE